jgi:SAM-dependent methyltransferase
MKQDQWENIHQTRGYDTIDSSMDWKLGYSNIDALLGDVSGKKLLDYGCGTGKYTRHLAGRGASIIGVDSSASAIDSAKMQGAKNIDYQVVANDDLSFVPTDSLDGAVATFTFCSFKTEEQLTKALRTIYERLKVGGSLCILDPHPDAPGRKYSTVYRTEPEQRVTGAPVAVHLKGLDSTVTNYWRPLENYQTCLQNAGFEITSIDEPKDETSRYDESTSAPYVIIRATK